MKVMNENKDLFSIENLDEMQKLQAYKLAYKCFKGLFWVMLAFSIALILPATTAENATFGFFSLAMEVCVFIFYLIFAGKSAKLGIMNPLYAKMASKTSYIVCYIALLITYIVLYLSKWFESQDIFDLVFGLYIAIAYASVVICCILARVNNKNVEKIDEE